MKTVPSKKNPTVKVVGMLLACASIFGLYILVFSSPEGEDSIKGAEVPPPGHTAPKPKAAPKETLVTARLSFEVK